MLTANKVYVLQIQIIFLAYDSMIMISGQLEYYNLDKIIKPAKINKIVYLCLSI